MKVLVFGSRKYEALENVYAILDAVHAAVPITLVIEGGQDGADTFGRQWAEDHGVPWQMFEADWESLGRKAGPLRNKQMEEAHPDLAIGFPLPGSVGTWNMAALLTRE